VGGVRDVVEAGVTGILVPPGNPNALAEALLAISHEPERARAMGAAGRRLAVRFSADRLVDDIERLYREALEEKRGGQSIIS
jgi:glycosyltransferase involved in cell wall biosynthesis